MKACGLRSDAPAPLLGERTQHMPPCQGPVTLSTRRRTSPLGNTPNEVSSTHAWNAIQLSQLHLLQYQASSARRSKAAYGFN